MLVRLGKVPTFEYRTFHHVLRDTNIYNKKIKGPILMELFTAAGELKKFFFGELVKFDVCTTCDTAHIGTIFKFLPHTRHHGCCIDPCRKAWIIAAVKNIDAPMMAPV
jgi:hypothetical protein